MTTTDRPAPLPQPLRLTEDRPAPGALRLHLAGGLDFDTAEQLLVTVRAHLAREIPLASYELDCAALTSCDSSGLSALLMTHRLTHAAGIPLTLTHRTPALDRLLHLTGTHTHFTRAQARDREVPGVG